MDTSSLDRSAITRLKGFAIALIVFHNYFHFVFEKTKENEIDFAAERFGYFLTDFAANPSEWVEAVFVYFGHFGVQLFVFASAYALALSYPRVAGVLPFLWSRVRKLYPSFLAAIALFCILPVQGGSWAPLAALASHAAEFALLLLGAYPLVPGNGYPVVGPWWFIPFIMQFYLLWALVCGVLVRSERRRLLLLACLSVLVNYTLSPWVRAALDVNLLLTPLGHLPEILSGVYCARFGIPRSKALPLLAAIVLLASGMHAALWPLHHISALWVLLPLGLVVLRAEERLPFGPFAWLGSISLSLFLVNGFLRRPFVLFVAPYEPGAIHVAAGIAFFAFACLVAHAVTLLVNEIRPDR